jgi:hypothetical protein
MWAENKMSLRRSSGETRATASTTQAAAKQATSTTVMPRPTPAFFQTRTSPRA